jgi:hypothetical protein
MAKPLQFLKDTMKYWIGGSIAIVSVTAVVSTAFAQAVALVEHGSEEGLARLARSRHKADFAALSNQFEAQSNKMFCGPTSATIVLNALRSGPGKAATRPLDRSAFAPQLFHNLPEGMEPLYPRYTQKTFFNAETDRIKTMEEVLGATGTAHVGDKPDFGFQLRQYRAALAAHGLDAELRIADEAVDDEQIKAELVRNLSQAGDYVIVNYSRKALGQSGGGHISPLAAYDEESDSFLIMDVNPNVAPWVWVKSQDLIAAMRTKDTVENRGYVLIREGSSAR